MLIVFYNPILAGFLEYCIFSEKLRQIQLQQGFMALLRHASEILFYYQQVVLKLCITCG